MKMKKIVAGLLSAAMVFTSVSFSGFQMDTAKAAEPARQNLAKQVTQTSESDKETNGLSAANLIDENKNTRWATHPNRRDGEWVNFTWSSEQTIQEIVISPEHAETSNSANILGYEITANDKVIYSERDKVMATEEVIVLSEPVKTTNLKITIKQSKAGGWGNVSFREVEFYTTPRVTISVQNDYNFAQAGTTSASSNEATTTTHDNVIDGDIRNGGHALNVARWSSNSHTNNSKQWFELDLNKAVCIKEVNLELFNRDVDPRPSNIQEFDLEFTLGNNKIVKHVVNTKPQSNSTGYKKEIEVVLDIPVVAQKIKVHNFTLCNTTSYPQVSIVEMGVYSNAQTNPFAAYNLNVTKNLDVAGNVTKPSTNNPNGAFVLGAEVSLTATANQNYKFVEWKKDNATLSTNATEKVIVNGNVDVQAVFEANNRAELGTKLEEAKTKVQAEYTATSWEKFNTAKAAAQGVYDNQASTYDAVAAQITALTNAMSELVREYTVTVNKGTINGETTVKVAAGSQVTVKANTPLAGCKFSHWLVDGEKVTEAETATFTINKDTTIQAEYVVSFNLSIRTQYNKKLNMGRFIAKRNVPEGVEVLENGIIITDQAGHDHYGDNFTVDVKRKVQKISSKTTLNGNYGVSLSKVKGAWYAKAYVKYRLSDGTEGYYYSAYSAPITFK